MILSADVSRIAGRFEGVIYILNLLEHSIEKTPIQSAIQERSKTAPHIPYLIAKVEDVKGSVHFLDPVSCQEYLKEKFIDPVTGFPCKSIKYYEWIQSKFLRHYFRRLHVSHTKEDVASIDPFIQCFFPCNLLPRLQYISTCIMESNTAEGNLWLWRCFADSKRNRSEAVVQSLAKLHESITARVAKIRYARFSDLTQEQLVKKLLVKYSS